MLACQIAGSWLKYFSLGLVAIDDAQVLEAMTPVFANSASMKCLDRAATGPVTSRLNQEI
jgi:hypothetical protein